MEVYQYRGEKHILLQCPLATISNPEIEQIQSEVFNFWENEPENVVLDLPYLQDEDTGKLSFLKDLSDHALELGCSFVIATENQAIQQFADDQQISAAPTQAEAVDMVFIETLERGFNQEE